ncbi:MULTISPECIES: TasA family protein [unclassified Modestobacter]
MSATTTATATRGRTARKIIGSLGVVGAAAAVAGLGTFGTFTDSTTPLNASVSTGKLDINLNQAGTATLPMNVAGFVPGDSFSRAVDLTNDGDLAFSGLKFSSTAEGSSVLVTDQANGLQLSIKSCPVAWTESTTGGATTYSCTSAPTELVAGPARIVATPADLKSLAVGGTDHLVITLSLPESADNRFQGQTSTLALTFTGTQATGTAR